jgi:coproporphyrinogen III oxidase-like Fe-S oxidoreductase
MTSSATNSTSIANCKKRHQLRQFYRLIVARLRSEFYPSSAWCFTRRGHAVDEYIIDADNYVGLGSGAFSYVNGVFYATTFSLRTYRALIAEGLSGIAVRSDLSRSDQMRYSLLVKMFGLGLNREWASQQFGGAFFKTVWPELKTLELLRAARRNKEGWELTERGMYWLVLMMSEFFESVARYREAMRTHAASEISAPAAESLDEPSACANELTPSC